MGESVIERSAPSAAGALIGLLAVQVRRAAIRFPAWHLCAGPVIVLPTDQRHEHA